MIRTNSVDALFDVLSDARRRFLVRYLMEADESEQCVDDLVDEIAEYEARQGRESPDYRSVAISLHHNHLPKLDDVGVVEYDERRTVVRFTQEQERRDVLTDLVAADGEQSTRNAK